jgi:peptidoglycan/LPS O-acetylase OafA/YrhL
MSGTSESQRQGYRPDIEGLRGVAVSLVVAFHALSKQLPGGFIGVDIFFVISGYLITGLLVREIEKTGALSLAGFYARRARRLLPASAVVFLATLLLCRVFLSPVQQYHLGDSGSHTALYISNFWFMGRSTDYFAPATANNPFLHTWSLAVEEQFYLVWPAIILLGLRGRHSRRTLFAVMILIAAGSFGACLWFTRTLAPWAFFSPLARAWEFAAGGIAFLLAAQEIRVNRGVRALGSWLGLAAIVGTAVLLHGQAGWPGWLAVIPVAGTAAILNGRVPGLGAASILELRISQWVGRHSYSWYLWHWPLLAVTAVMQPPLFSRHLYVVMFCVGGSLALAVATHAVVENPIRFSRYLAPRRRLSLAGVGLVTVLTAGTAFLWQRSASREVSALGLGKAVDASQGLEGCPAVGFLETKVIECDNGSPASKSTLVLFGDSHASQWFPAFKSITNDRGWRLVLIYKPGCPTARVTNFSTRLNRIYTECDAWREAAIQRILEIQPAVVVLANFQWQDFPQGANGRSAIWREASRKTLETLDSAGLKTIVLRDTPLPGFDIPGCLAGDSSWWSRKRNSRKNTCMLDRAQVLDGGVFHAEQQAVAGLPHSRVLDLSDLFCDGAVCPPVKNGLVVYRDSNHISGEFARSLAPAVSGRLAPLIF